MYAIFKHFTILLMTALLVIGCSSTPNNNGNVTEADREKLFDRNQDRLANLTSWHFDGRFSVKSAQSADSANISWLQQQDRYLLKISGPLNQGTIFLHGDQTSISYKDAKGNVDTAPTPEALIARHTNYELPISSLRYWVLGLPDPRYAYELNIADTGDLNTLVQNGWKIRYEAFSTHNPYRLPSKITLKHPGLNITVSIYAWNPKLAAG